MDEPDYYAVLGIAPDADAEGLRVAYRLLARRYHPDVAGTGSLERMQVLNQAYTVLSDPEAREAYHLRRGLPLPTTARTSSNGATAHSGAPAERSAPVRPSPERSAPPSRPRAPSQSGRGAPVHPSAPKPPATRTSGGPFARIATFSATAGPVAALALTADSERVGVGALDGTVSFWAVRSAERLASLGFGAERRAGVLQGLRLSPGGALVVAWGFALGISVWQVSDQRVLWSSKMSAPRGLLDAVPRDDPPSLRLARPAAQQSLAEIDPFRWAHEGREGTALVTRLLAGPMTYGAVEPVLAMEERGQRATRRGSEDDGWRVRERVLSADGRRLLTFASVREASQEKRVLSLWDIEHRAPLVGTVRPRRVAHQIERGTLLGFPLAASPDLEWLALNDGGDALAVRGLRERAHLRVTVGRLPEDALMTLAPNARYVALAREHTLDVYDPHAGDRCQHWEFPAEVSALAFAAGDLLAVGLASGQVELWRAG